MYLQREGERGRERGGSGRMGGGGVTGEEKLIGQKAQYYETNSRVCVVYISRR